DLERALLGWPLTPSAASNGGSGSRVRGGDRAGERFCGTGLRGADLGDLVVDRLHLGGERFGVVVVLVVTHEQFLGHPLDALRVASEWLQCADRRLGLDRGSSLVAHHVSAPARSRTPAAQQTASAWINPGDASLTLGLWLGQLCGSAIVVVDARVDDCRGDQQSTEP